MYLYYFFYLYYINKIKNERHLNESYKVNNNEQKYDQIISLSL